MLVNPEVQQPLGKPVPNWTGAKWPTSDFLVGKTCSVVPLTVQHAPDLYQAYGTFQMQKKNFTYLGYGPFETLDAYEAWVQSVIGKTDPMFYAIIDSKTGKAVGVASYLGVYPEQGSIEIGHLNFSPLMQRSIISSEAFILMAQNAYKLGNRTLVWRCHSLNAASLAAAKRYGFQYECIFRNYMVMKGHNRNTPWLSITIEEWPVVNQVYSEFIECALAGNYQSLSSMMDKMVKERGPYLPQHEEIWQIFPSHQNHLRDFPKIHEEIYINEQGLPVGKPVKEWKNPPQPLQETILGQNCKLEYLESRHYQNLWEAFSLNKNGSNWMYTAYGPFADYDTFEQWIEAAQTEPNSLVFAVINLQTEKAVGISAFIHINPGFGSIEIGHLNFSLLIQQTAISSEAVIMMIRHAFGLGYRRVGWVCHSKNSKAINAAKRYGFSYEGVFRNYSVVKGHSHDIAWFSITVEDWFALNEVYTDWLELVNKKEHSSLSEMVQKLKIKNI